MGQPTKPRNRRIVVAACLLVGLLPLLANEARANHNGDVVYRRSTDGVSFSSAVNLSNDPAPTGIARAAAGNGVLHVTWDSGGQPQEVQSRRSPTDGLNFEATRNVSSTAGDSSENEVAASGATVLYVWEDDLLNANGTVDNSFSGDEAYARRSSDAGVTVTPAPSSNPLNVSNTPNGHTRDPVVAVSGSLAAVAHEDPIGANDEIFVETSTDGGATWTSGRNVSNDSAQSAEPALAITGSSIHAVWDDRGDSSLGYARSTNGGATWFAATNLPGSAERAGGVAASGNTVNVVGCTAGGGDLIHYRSTDGGGTWSGGTDVGNGCGKPKIAVDGDDVYAVWEDESSGQKEVMYRRSTDGGATWLAPQNLSNNGGGSEQPAVAVDPSTGTVHIVWFDSSEPPPPPAPATTGTTTTTRPPTTTTTRPPTTTTTRPPTTTTTRPPTTTTTRPPPTTTTTTRPPTTTTTTRPPTTTTTTRPPTTTTIRPTTTTQPTTTTIRPTTTTQATTTTTTVAVEGALRYARGTGGGSSFAGPIVLSGAPSASGNSAVAADNGVVHVGFDTTSSPGEVRYRRSANDGSSFETERNVSENAGDSLNTDVAVSGSSVVAVWEDEHPDPGFSGHEVVGRHSADAGSSFSPATPVNISDTPGTHSRDPSVAGAPGLFVVVYEEAVGGNDEIMVQRSTDGGATWSPAFNLSQDPSQSAEPEVTIVGAMVHVVWEDAATRRIAHAQSTDGGATFSAHQLLPVAVSRHPVIGATSSALQLAGCRGLDGRAMSYRSTDGGATWTGGALGRGCRGTSLATNGNEVHVAWLDSTVGEGDVQFRRSTNGGGTFSPALNLSAGGAASTAPSVTADPVTGTVHVTWYDLGPLPPGPTTTTLPTTTTVPTATTTTVPTTTTTTVPTTTTTTTTTSVPTTTTTSPGTRCTLTGTEDDDVIWGTPGDDVLCGLGGNDVMIGGDGDDQHFGGPGYDGIDARDGVGGNDVVDGGEGPNMCRSDPGDTVTNC